MDAMFVLEIAGIVLVILTCLIVLWQLQRRSKSTPTDTSLPKHPELVIAILAAGQGKRMLSRLPKVLHPLAGVPLLTHVFNLAQTLAPDTTYVVYGHGGDLLRETYPNTPVQWVRQAEQLGTGHAVEQVIGHLHDHQQLLVLYGDVPLLTASTLTRLIEKTPHGALGLLVATVDDPTGLGRVVRSSDPNASVKAIVEDRDADAFTRTINEIYTGVMLAPVGKLKTWLRQIHNHNSQGEYYLTSIVALAIAEGTMVVTSAPTQLYEVAGVNDRSQLAELERIHQREQARQLALAGVSIADLNRLDIRGQVTPAPDSFIDVNVILQGNVVLGEGCRIGPHCVLTDVIIAPGVDIRAHSVIEGASLGADAIVGPFARIRPGTILHDRAVVGNFVEVKKSTLGTGSKASHLSYLGDATIGKGVNIGAGTITCNYDGVNKHQTVIGDGAFIGSNTSLVAPITIGEMATIAAGSTVSKEVPAGQLTIARARPVTILDWQRPEKQTK